MRFYYKAKKISGEEIKGTKDANDEFELAKILQKEGYILIFSKEEGIKRKFNFSFLNFLGRVPISEKMIFSRNLAVMLSAGISLSRGIETLSRQTQNAKFRETLKAVAEEIKKGKSFNESLKNYPKIFSPVFIAMIKAGETTGKLDDSLRILSEQLQGDYDLRRRVKGALIYPAVVIATMVIIGILMMIYVVPTLISTFKELEVELPVSTKILIAVSDFLENNGIWAVLMFALAAGIAFYIRSLPKIKYFFDFIFLHLPLIAPLVIKVNTARTSRTLSSLIGSGVNILEALEISGGILQNSYYKNILNEAKEKVQKGEPMSKIFVVYPKLYPPIFSDMISVGEETGKLSEMLLRVATFYEDEINAATKNLSTIIEPILMIVIGAAVGFFAYSMLQPMYSMLQGI